MQAGGVPREHHPCGAPSKKQVQNTRQKKEKEHIYEDQHREILTEENCKYQEYKVAEQNLRKGLYEGGLAHCKAVQTAAETEHGKRGELHRGAVAYICAAVIR